MSTVQRIAKNTAVLLIAQMASCLLAFFYMIYIARCLGAEGFGILSFALAFTGIFGILTDVGLSLLTVREVARDKSLAPKYLANISLMKVILVTITFGLIALTINLMGYPEQTIKVVYLVALSVIFMAFTQMFYSIFRAFERMEFQSIGQVLNSALILGGVIFAMRWGFSVVGFASLYFFASVIVLVYSFAVMKLKFSNLPASLLNKAMEFDWSFWKTTIKQSWVFAVGGIFATIYFMIDRIMLSIMKGDAIVGYYSAAYNLINVLSFIPSAFVAALFPVMSNYFRTSPDSLNKTYQHSAKYMYMLAVPIAVGTVLLSRRIVLIIYGGEFLPLSAQTLNILIWAELLIFILLIMSYMLVSIDKQKITTLNAGVGAALNVGLNFLLIPRMSLIGAAIATVASDIYFFISSAYFLSKYHYKLNFPKIIPIPLVASAIMGGFVYHFSQTTLFIVIPLSALIYFGILYITRYISNEDITLVKQALRIKGKGGDVD